ncbi:hypothetical protein NKH86_29875 [Mesorhizobium sp. M0913]|uniref:hypothetical protein n=1 Tax=Mesorhizobium sp. M0913 TaxID=2957026 RepID=UPI00333A7CFB
MSEADAKAFLEGTESILLASKATQARMTKRTLEHYGKTDLGSAGILFVNFARSTNNRVIDVPRDANTQSGTNIS